MESWYALEVDKVSSFRKMTSKIQIKFDTFFLKFGSPYNMGVYSRKDTEKDIVTFYFSPAAQPIAEKFDAVKCDPPAKEGLEFSVGPDSCLGFYPVEPTE